MPAYNQQSLIDLSERTQYESWLLEAAYDIVDDSIFPEWPDQLIYPPNGGDPLLIGYGRANIVIGDWRPQFLQFGAPLVFVTTFKLLDMLFEWVLEHNGHASTHRFQQKIAALKNNLIFPPFIAWRPWLSNRLVGLYEHLEPLRGTIVHARNFKTSAGDLRVSSSRRGNVGPVVTLSQKDLRALAVLVVSLLRYLEGTWQVDVYREKVLCRTLDELDHLHHFPSLGQLPPRFLTVRVYSIASPTNWVDLSRIRNDIARHCPRQDVVFDLRLVTIAADGSGGSAYIFPWNEIQKENDQITRTALQLMPYADQLPPDVDATAVADALLSCPSEIRIAG